MRDFIITLIICSVTMLAVILAYIAITPLLAKRYQVKWRYYAWLIIVFGLIIPFRPQFNNAIVKVDTQSGMSAPVIQIGNASPITIPFINTEPMEPFQPAKPASINISLWQVATIAWLAGVIFFLAYHGVKHYRFSKMTKRWSEIISDGQTVTLFQRIKEEMKISQNIGLYSCSSIGSPMMVGFINPRILFPECDFDQDELGFILKHELVHYKRKDLLYKSLVLIATIIHWFNPIVYLMAKAIDMQCELSCDDAVIKHTNHYVRQQYSETIIGVVKFKSKMTTALSTNYCGGVKGMKKRILSILDTAPKKTGAVILCAALLLIAISGSFIMITKIINDDLEKNLNLLKSGDTKSLTGFAIGDPIDYELVDETEEYHGGGRISKLKSGKYSDIYLFFSEATYELECLGAEDTGNFFGIILGQTNLQTITDILGEPDVYEEESDMWNLPFAIYNFENTRLSFDMDSEYKIIRILYRPYELGSSPDEIYSETEPLDKIETAAEKQPGILYVSEKLAFSIEFPAEWEGLYEIEEDNIEHSMRGGAGITVYQKASHYINPLYGELFYLERWIGTYTTEAPPIMAGYCGVVLEVGKYTYMLRTPSSVTFFENDKDIAEEYRRLFNQLDIIMSNVQFSEDTYYSNYAHDPAAKEFLDSEEGQQLRSTAYDAAIAYLKADVGELEKCMINPDEAKRMIRNQTNIYDKLVWLCYKYTDNDRSDGQIITAYEFLLNGGDSFTYITTSFEKVDGIWMVSFIAGEK